MDSSPIGDEQQESRSGDEAVKNEGEEDANSFSGQNAKRKPLDSCGTAYLCLDIGGAPDTKNCPDFFAPIN
jgi:hypothetical protein